MTRLADREKTRDEAMVRVTKLQARHRRYRDIDTGSETLGILIEELRRCLRADRATVANTLRRVVTKSEIRKDGGTVYISVP